MENLTRGREGKDKPRENYSIDTFSLATFKDEKPKTWQKAEAGKKLKQIGTKEERERIK